MTDRNGASQKRVALVIGSGAVKCAAALGLWKVLRQENIPADMLVGCSGGSIHAATMALGYGLEDCFAMTKRLWDRKVTGRRNLPALLRAVFPDLFKFDERFGMFDDTEVYRRLSQVFEERTFEATLTPLYLVATDFSSGEQVVLTIGRSMPFGPAFLSLISGNPGPLKIACSLMAQPRTRCPLKLQSRRARK